MGRRRRRRRRRARRDHHNRGRGLPRLVLFGGGMWRPLPTGFWRSGVEGGRRGGVPCAPARRSEPEAETTGRFCATRSPSRAYRITSPPALVIVEPLGVRGVRPGAGAARRPEAFGGAVGVPLVPVRFPRGHSRHARPQARPQARPGFGKGTGGRGLAASRRGLCRPGQAQAGRAARPLRPPCADARPDRQRRPTGRDGRRRRCGSVRRLRGAHGPQVRPLGRRRRPGAPANSADRPTSAGRSCPVEWSPSPPAH